MAGRRARQRFAAERQTKNWPLFRLRSAGPRGLGNRADQGTNGTFRRRKNGRILPSIRHPVTEPATEAQMPDSNATDKVYITADELLSDSFRLGLEILDSGYRPTHI